MSEAGSSGSDRLQKSGISKLSNQMIGAKVVGLLKCVRPDASDEVGSSVQGCSEKTHQRIPKVGRHRLLGSTLRILLGVGLAVARRCLVLLHQSSVTGDRDGEDESDDVVGRVSHGGDQIGRQKVSILFDEIVGAVTNVSGKMSNDELVKITI